MSIAIENRNRSYEIEKERLPQKLRLVYSWFQGLGPKTSQEVADMSGIPINEVVGRVSELKQIGLITEVGSTKNPNSRRKNTLYDVVPPHEIEQVLKDKKADLKMQFDELCADSYKDLSHSTMLGVQNKMKTIKKQLNVINQL